MDPDRFRPDAPADLVCAVCQCVPAVNDLAVVAPCDHHGCRGCFKPWLAANGNCPVCRGAATARDLRDASRTTRNILAAWRVACGSSGCKEAVSYESLAAHEASCPKRREACAHCGSSVLTRNLDKHEASCARKPEPCPGGCGASFPPADAGSHSCVKYLQSMLRRYSADAMHWYRLFLNGTRLAGRRVLAQPSLYYSNVALVRVVNFAESDLDYALFGIHCVIEAAHKGGGSWGAAFDRLLCDVKLDGIAKVVSARFYTKGPANPRWESTEIRARDTEGSIDGDGTPLALASAIPTNEDSHFGDGIILTKLTFSGVCLGAGSVYGSVCGRAFGQRSTMHVVDAEPLDDDSETDELRKQLAEASIDDCFLLLKHDHFAPSLRGNVDAALCRACTCKRLRITL